jgi:hypothetical protein
VGVNGSGDSDSEGGCRGFLNSCSVVGNATTSPVGTSVSDARGTRASFSVLEILGGGFCGLVGWGELGLISLDSGRFLLDGLTQVSPLPTRVCFTLDSYSRASLIAL